MKRKITEPDMCGPAYGRYATWHEVDIAVPVEQAWQEVVDFDNWPTWNPLYTESRGGFAPGNVIEFTVEIPGMPSHHGKAKVIDFQPGKSIRYQMLGNGILTRATRFIELRAGGPSACTLVNGETMGGLLGPLLFRTFSRKIRLGLQGMNEALKARLEARS